MSPRWMDSLKERFTHARADADLERELRSHLDAEAEEQIERGVSPDEAPYAARRALGNLPLIQEYTRRSWPWGRLAVFARTCAGSVRQDVRYGLRGLLKQPAFTTAAVLTLALGIGAATTIFSVIQNVLLDPYPMYAHVDRLVNVRIRDAASARPGGRGAFSVPELLDYQAQATAFEEVIGGTGEPVIYTSAEGAEQLNGGLTTANTFTFLGVPAFVGRTFTMDDMKPGAPPVFVMSYKLWANRFGLDPGLIGRSFTLNGVPATLIGVMPPRVSKLAADVWRPVRLDRADPSLRNRYFMFQARLKRDVTIEQAEAELNVIARHIANIYPRDYPPKFNVEVVGIIDAIVGGFRRTLYTMAAAVALLLLIACANVANLLLSRAAGREREMALRGSLGASRARLVGQLLVESLLLAFAGAAAGCAFAYVGITLLAGAIPEGLIPRESLIRLDVRALIFSLGIAALTAVLFGLAPALQTVRRDLLHPLRNASRGAGGSLRGRRLSSALVVGQIALSLVLLNSAGLLMRSFIKLQDTDLGLDPENLLVVTTYLAPAHRTTAAAQQQFLADVLAHVRSVPGVVSAATVAGFPPFGGPQTEIEIPGTARDERRRAMIELCSDDYLRTVGLRLLRGRDLTADDMSGNRRVALANQTFVERYFEGKDPIGRVVRVVIENDEGAPAATSFDVVGVAADARNDGITDPVQPQIFLPSPAASMGGRRILVRTAVPPLTLVRDVKHAVWSADRGVPVADATAMTEYIRRFGYAEPGLGLYVFGAFAAIGLGLVVLGVYSLVAYTVARRTHEIGIRMAVGASRRDVLHLTVGIGVRWIAVGVAVGLLASLAATRLLTNQLWEVSPTDPLTLASVIAVVAMSAVFASYIPALRATRVDPMVVLRCE